MEATPSSACNALTTGSQRLPTIDPRSVVLSRGIRSSAAVTALQYSATDVGAAPAPKLNVASHRQQASQHDVLPVYRASWRSKQALS